MKIYNKILFALICFLVVINGQNVNQVIIGSQDNTIDIVVSNQGYDTAEDLVVKISKLPKWFEIVNNDYYYGDLNIGEEKTLHFSFNINNSAPQDTSVDLEFLITSASGESWSKKIPLYVTVPNEYSLKQNYPNPFNPITNISYELPYNANVTLKIYDIIGQEIATLVNKEQSAGIHNILWNANNFASGTYFYVLNTKNELGKHSIKKKMTIVK